MSSRRIAWVPSRRIARHHHGSYRAGQDRPEWRGAGRQGPGNYRNDPRLPVDSAHGSWHPSGGVDGVLGGRGLGFDVAFSPVWFMLPGHAAGVVQVYFPRVRGNPTEPPDQRTATSQREKNVKPLRILEVNTPASAVSKCWSLRGFPWLLSSTF